MKKRIRIHSIATALLAAILLFGFAAIEANAADVHMTNDTTRLENGNRYIVSGDKTVGSRIDVQKNATVRLNFKDGGRLWANHGIYVPAGSKLVIEGKGHLWAVGDDFNPGIGGIKGDTGGQIRINSKRIIVEATGGMCGAGIGGAHDTDFSGAIIIDDGYVISKGSEGGAGIGTGRYGDCLGNITIRNGEVYATGSDHENGGNGAAGIGSGVYSDMKSEVNIHGGNIHAEGGLKAAGIGAGAHGNAGEATINISGGYVQVKGQQHAAGIGGGCENAFPVYTGGEGATVNITGGTVNITSGWCAIGHGYDDEVMGTLTIADHMKVYAGNDGTNYERDGKPFTADERVDACQYRRNAFITECDHPDHVYTFDETGHTQSCKYCKTTFQTEAHDLKDVEGTAIEATCAQMGRSADQKCEICGYAKAGQDTEYSDHDWGEWEVTQEATTQSDGLLTRVCKVDPSHTETRVIPKIEPADGGTAYGIVLQYIMNLIDRLPENYAQVAKAQVERAVILYNTLSEKAKGLITDAEREKLQNAINYLAEVKETAYSSLKMKAGRTALLTWTKTPDADGYQLWYKTKGDKAKKLMFDNAQKVKTTITNLKAGKTYTFKIRPYTEVEDLSTGKIAKVFGKWSKAKKARVKK